MPNYREPKRKPSFLRVFASFGIFCSSDRGGTRTLDQRINVPHRLSPTIVISIVTRLLATRFRSQVESLDYTIAIAGVPRLVSGAGTGDPPDPCLLITQSLAFSNHHACRCQRRCGGVSSQGVPAYCGIHSSRFGFFPREAPTEVRCSTD